MQNYERVDRLACLLVLSAALIAPRCTAQQPTSESALSSERQAPSKNVVNTVGQLQPVPPADATHTEGPVQPGDDAQAVSEFNKRVAEYVKLHKSLESTPGVPAKAEPEAIAVHQKQLAAAIQTARKGARPGDILSPAESYLRRLIGGDLRKDGDARKTALTAGNPKSESPTQPVTLAVNAAYPEKAPVSTVPAMLLLRLPPLPEELNYRFVGRHLILHDIHANLIVDYLLNAIP